MVGSVFPTNTKSAFSGGSASRFRMTYTNWPTVRSPGTKNFCLSTIGTSAFAARIRAGGGDGEGAVGCSAIRSYVSSKMHAHIPERSTMTGTRPGNFSRMRRASAWRFSARDERGVQTKQLRRRVRTSARGRVSMHHHPIILKALSAQRALACMRCIPKLCAALKLMARKGVHTRREC